MQLLCVKYRGTEVGYFGDLARPGPGSRAVEPPPPLRLIFPMSGCG